METCLSNALTLQEFYWYTQKMEQHIKSQLKYCF